MNKSTDVAIITTGSEVIAGDIDNANSRWISSQLSKNGYSVKLHLSCDDTESAIASCLKTSSEFAGIIFLTGGLGPTSDDITRHIIAKYFDNPLQYHEKSWVKILEITDRPEKDISETNKRQCYFPENSVIITNPKGTADAFLCQNQEVTVVAVPGPPHENQPLIKRDILPWLKEHIPPARKSQLKWTLLGIPESSLAEIVEKALEGVDVSVAYRAHFPFIDLKMSCPLNRYAALQSIFIDLEKSLSDYLLSTDPDFDSLQSVQKNLFTHKDIQVIDMQTDGFFAKRFTDGIKTLGQTAESLSILTQIEKEKTDFEFVKNAYSHLSESGLLLLISPQEQDRSWNCLFQRGEFLREATFEIPNRYVKRSKERVNRYVTEKSLLFFSDCLNSFKVD